MQVKSLKAPSKSAVNRAVISRAAQRPLSIYPISMGLLGGFAAVILGPSTLALGMPGAGIALSVGGMAAKYFMGKEELAGRYMSDMRMETVRQREQVLRYLEEDLTSVNELSGLKQIELFREKHYD